MMMIMMMMMMMQKLSLKCKAMRAVKLCTNKILHGILNCRELPADAG